jgi:succinate dehydrogenase flavin-adding protein (antitoxin of CptAB toxin-antitoxin module)
MDKKETTFLLDKAKFKSRRGLNELDQILVPFVQNEFNSLEEKEKFLLVELLEFEDVDLADLILYRKIEPEIKFEEIILKIIKFSSEI